MRSLLCRTSSDNFKSFICHKNSYIIENAHENRKIVVIICCYSMWCVSDCWKSCSVLCFSRFTGTLPIKRNSFKSVKLLSIFSFKLVTTCHAYINSCTFIQLKEIIYSKANTTFLFGCTDVGYISFNYEALLSVYRYLFTLITAKNTSSLTWSD